MENETIRLANQYFEEKYGIHNFFKVETTIHFGSNTDKIYRVSSPFSLADYSPYQFHITDFLELGKEIWEIRSTNLQVIKNFKRVCPSLYEIIMHKNNRKLIKIQIFGISVCLMSIEKYFTSIFYSQLVYPFIEKDINSARDEAIQLKENPEYQNFWKYVIEHDFLSLTGVTRYSNSYVDVQKRTRFLATLSDETRKLYFATETLYDLKNTCRIF